MGEGMQKENSHMNKFKYYLLFILLLTLILFTAGCATLEGPADPEDPLESYNRAIFQFNDSIDVNFLQPVATVYQDHMPAVINTGVTNFFSNLDDVVVLANDILQLKFGQAAFDLFRIFFNTTIGLLGVIDVATHLDLEKHDEDFGQTLGYWGVPSGPYFIIPLFGPSTIRDAAGFATDSVYIDPVYRRLSLGTALTAEVVDAIDNRAGLLFASNLMDAVALDRYIYLKDAYLQRRQYLVYDGDPPEEDFDE